MRVKGRKYAAVLLASSVAIGGVISPVDFNGSSSAYTAEAAAVVPTANLVYLSKRSSVKLMSGDIVPNEDKDQFVMKLRVYNNEASSLEIIDYKFYLKDKKGQSYKMVRVQPATIKNVPTAGYIDLVYVADVGLKRKAEEFNISINKIDLAAKNYERAIGTIVIPKGYTKVYHFMQKASFSLGATTVNATVHSSRRYVETIKSKEIVNGKEKEVETKKEKYQFVFDLTNAGNWSTTLDTNTLYFVRTVSGLMYPLQAKEEQLSLLPQQTKKLDLNGEVPLGVNLTNAHLFIATRDTQTNTLIPYVTYKVPPAKLINNPDEEEEKEDITSVDWMSTQKFKIGDDEVSIQGKSVIKYPSQSQDWIMATLVVTNNNSVAVKSPDFDTALSLNGVNVGNKLTIIENGNGVINANTSREYTIYVPVSYKENYSTMTIDFKNKNDKEPKTLVSYLAKLPQTVVPASRQMNQTWNTLDQSAQMTIRNMNVYEGTRSDTLTMQLDYKNLDRRIASVKELTGYLINNQGNMYAANIVLPQTADLTPNGTGSILITSSIPKNVGLTDFKLVLGEEMTAADQKIFINPVQVSLQITKPDTSDLVQMPILTNELTIRNVLAQVVDATRFRLEFNYDYFEGLASYEWSVGERNIILELVDPNNGATYEKTLSLSGEDGLSYGKGKFKSIDFSDDLFFSRVPYFNDYKLNVYEELNGGKRLIGSRQLEWMLRSSD